MVDVFLIVAIVVAFLILAIVGFYVLVKYQHPDDKNEAWFPKLVVWTGFVIAGATVLLLPLDVANNDEYPGKSTLFDVLKHPYQVLADENCATLKLSRN